MKQKYTLILLNLIILALGVGLYIRSIPLEDARGRIESFARSGPGFTSKEIPLTEFEESMIGDASGYKIIYFWRGQRFAITILDGTYNRHAVHDPRYCFRGAGWQITEDKQILLGGGSARWLTLNRAEEKSVAAFFYSTGEDVFDSPIRYWISATQRRWLRHWGGPEPVLMMMQPIDENSDLSLALTELVPLLSLP